MTILHVTDFHFNKRWFDWLLHRAPPHDLAVISGDLLDLASTTPHHAQIAWVTDWLNAYPRPLSLCSGNHDREWDSRARRWTPAYWLRKLTNPCVWTDGEQVEMNSLSVLNIGSTTRPKGGQADIWVVHTPPAGTYVAARAGGGGGAGDPDLIAAVRRYTPRLVLSGHVHHPLHWRDHAGPCLFLNPGHTAGASFPNHILIDTDHMSYRYIAADRRQVVAEHRPIIAFAPVRAPAREVPAMI